MTSTEILAKEFGDKYKNKTIDGQMVIDILSAMDEYAKQQMIAFTDWHTSIKKPFTFTLEMRKKYNKDTFTTEEIVNEYLLTV